MDFRGLPHPHSQSPLPSGYACFTSEQTQALKGYELLSRWDHKRFGWILRSQSSLYIQDVLLSVFASTHLWMRWNAVYVCTVTTNLSLSQTVVLNCILNSLSTQFSNNKPKYNFLNVGSRDAEDGGHMQGFLTSTGVRWMANLSELSRKTL